MTICYSLCSFATFLPVSVSRTKKNLATLVRVLHWDPKSFLRLKLWMEASKLGAYVRKDLYPSVKRVTANSKSSEV
jgi:hypothetical protein